MDTWEKVDVVSQPELTVVYNDTDANTEDDIEDWEAYVSIDFTELNKIATSSASFTYNQGTSSRKFMPNGDSGTPDFLQNGRTSLDTSFFYDTDTGTDYRLNISDPGLYNFQLELQVVQPNGTTRNYEFLYEDIAVPGTISSFTYYNTYINAILGDYCLSCHGDSNSDAYSEFELVAEDESKILAKIDTPTEGKEILTYPFTSEHTGFSFASSIPSEEKGYFEEFITLLLAEKENNGANITTDIDLKEIPKPSIMEMDPWN
ncbi:hypothetical protein QWZ13_04870 [Reinekea marina]|uniref:Uncharacterized protein n=1 Tax=Reinekea marina TaxID=1310421 RepID=A0ABV7WRQ8_9GAMM|nr:hypothetical protein [Reinekea marina]MDN3648239.1 hypothetical protein [Reinekea marina]